MIRRITGAILALLIVNPFCCCLGAAFSSQQETETSAAPPASPPHACCASHENTRGTSESSGDRSDENTPCDCDSHGHSQALLPEGLTQVKLLAQFRDSEWELPGLLTVPAIRGSLEATSIVFLPDRHSLRLHYPCSLSPGRYHAIVHGVFLI